VYNVAFGERISLNKLWTSLQEASGVKLEATYGPPRLGDVRDSLADIDKANKMMGYNPKFNVQEGLKVTWDYFKPA
jgi:UDP-N-acetylglucosamine 4-epimerase